jgi:hypothetical protein
MVSYFRQSSADGLGEMDCCDLFDMSQNVTTRLIALAQTNVNVKVLK